MGELKEEKEENLKSINGVSWKLEYFEERDRSSGEMPVPVFYAREKDVKEGTFEAFIEKIEEIICEYGVCKIVPPETWSPTSTEDVLHRRADRTLIPKPICQHATGRKGVYRTYLVEQKQMRVGRDYKPLATDRRNQASTPRGETTLSMKDIERG